MRSAPPGHRAPWRPRAGGVLSSGRHGSRHAALGRKPAVEPERRRRSGASSPISRSRTVSSGPDNFLSNEVEYQWVIPTLTSTLGTGGVYLGVGSRAELHLYRGVAAEAGLHRRYPARQPRRAAALQGVHRDVGRSRRVPVGCSRAEPSAPGPVGSAGPTADIEQLMAAYQHEEPSAELFDRNLQAAKEWLLKHHSFALSDEDLSGLEYVYKAFYDGGPDLNYSFPNGGFFRGGNFPTYADLMSETDGRGEHRSYLATENQFQTLNELEKNNAIVPVVGNFAGTERRCARSAATCGSTTPRSPRSTRRTSRCISSSRETTGRSSTATSRRCPSPKRAHSSARCRTGVCGSSFETMRPARRASTRLNPIADLIRAYRAGRIGGYYDVIAMSR